MAVGERQTQKHRRKTPSFSSSLLDAIYLSIDEPGCAAAAAGQHHQQSEDFVHLRSTSRRNNAAHFEDEIESLRRAIMVEKWMENHTTTTTTAVAAAAAVPRRHISSNSGTSSDSSILSSSSETDSSVLSRSSSSSKNHLYTRTKSKAIKIYGELKKVKEPISPGGKIVNFFNSIFSPRNPKQKQTTVAEEWSSSSIRKSRSMRDPPTTSSKSCLIKNPSSSRCNKLKRSVKFDENEYSVNASMPIIKSRLIKKSVELFENESDGDDMSCASSDLFELENIGSYGSEELPVYGTTSIKMNRAIACGFAM